ncbi:C-Myc-binding protein isoform X2 [Petaurus breviceps papuanus]|uniref:C-Myc-binding protein isoform X2 n=1 Tax=Petaurus breviceps papuanus TaxID=3040969 RepID=UPI0036D7714D
MKTGPAPAPRARGPPVRRRTRLQAHAQFLPQEPGSHGVGRAGYAARCHCHYGPLQSRRLEAGAVPEVPREVGSAGHAHQRITGIIPV